MSFVAALAVIIIRRVLIRRQFKDLRLFGQLFAFAKRLIELATIIGRVENGFEAAIADHAADDSPGVSKDVCMAIR